MLNLDETKDKKNELYSAVAAALSSGNEEQIKASVLALQDYNKEELKAIYNEYEENKDEAILESRGVKALTSEETKFWNSFIGDAKRRFGVKNSSSDGVYTGIEELLPTTEHFQIVEELKREHPLLSKIRFQATTAVTKWTIDNSAEQRATWHPLNTPITTALEGGPFITVDMTLCKLTSYMFVSQDMLDLGPRWVAAYATTLLKESIALGLEYGIIRGSVGAVNEPIGMLADYKKPKDATTGYPKREAIKCTGFTKEFYGEMLAQMSIKDNGRTQGISSVLLIVSPYDFFTKIFPATTAMTTEYKYVNNVFPFPTVVVQSTFVDPGEAIMGIAPDYFFGLGSLQSGRLEYSDEYKFLEDLRTYKIKLHGNGQPTQYNAFARLDISDLEEVFPVIATTDRPKNAYLASLTLGDLELSPAFDRLKKNYTATATSASAAINVAAKDGDSTVVIKSGDTVIQNGGNVAFANNAVTTVTVTVTNGDAESVYTIAVTRGTPTP
ncbi:MAG: phage major capsid protein [Prevotella sp.]|nr:phage major capsid protein [Prevotella sp.]